MPYTLRSFVLFAVFSTLSHAASSPPIAARYVGNLHHTTLKRDQLAKLDLILTGEEGTKTTFMGILSLHFGDFTSPEYVSYHYENVAFLPDSKELIFERTDQEIAIQVTSLSSDWKDLKAQVRSALGGKLIGELDLSLNKPPRILNPLIEPLRGEYKGTCEDFPRTLQIRTFRSNQEVSIAGDPFGFYDVRGHLAPGNSPFTLTCPKDSARPCVRRNFNGGNYQFFKNSITLWGDGKHEKCSTVPEGLLCDGCILKRISGDQASSENYLPNAYRFDKNALWNNPNLDLTTSIAGDYAGYVHHDHLNIEQRGRLSILVSTNTGNGTFTISATGSLIFGDWSSDETLGYQYDTVTVDPKKKLKSLLLSRPGGHVDSAIQITSLTPHKIKGIWYSLLFGRVGEFEFTKGDEPPAPSSKKVMEQVSGIYEWVDYLKQRPITFYLNVPVVMGKAKTNLANPFAPLTFASYYETKNHVFPRTYFQGGSYDFYTGEISLGGVWTGKRVDRQNVSLMLTQGRVAFPLYYYEPYATMYMGPIE